MADKKKKAVKKDENKGLNASQKAHIKRMEEAEK